MGIHASDNVSHLAHQEKEPFVPEHYDYDEYVIFEGGRLIEAFGERSAWDRARARFLRLFNEEKRAVKLLGRVFN